MKDLNIQAAGNLVTYDSDYLKELRNQITRELNRRTKVLRNQIKVSIQKGDRVTLKTEHPKVAGKTLIVEKIKIKKADVKVEGTGPYEGRWTVPITMLQKILK